MERALAVLAVVVLTPSIIAVAWVSKDKYDANSADARSARASLASAVAHDKAQQAQEAALRAQMGALSTTDSDLRAQLDKLRQARAAAEARAHLLDQLEQTFKSMIDAGQLQVATRNGRLVLQLPNDVLFDSGETAIKPAGQQALVQVAHVLATLPGRAFQVAGHTDNVPIQSPRFPSNWELSTARAVQVVKLLVAQGVDPKALSAAGYGEFDPLADNGTPDGRAQNRRIEITLQPRLDELVSLP